jgi:hypothetical protein
MLFLTERPFSFVDLLLVAHSTLARKRQPRVGPAQSFVGLGASQPAASRSGLALHLR